MLASLLTASLVYVAIGDSITTGFAAEPYTIDQRYSWATGLEESFAVQVEADKSYNLAFPGITANLIDYQVEIAKRLKPNVVTILAGANDLCWGMGDKIAPKIKAIVSELEADVILVGGLPDFRQVYNLQKPGKACILSKIACHSYFMGDEAFREAIDQQIVEVNNELRDLEGGKVLFVDINARDYKRDDISTIDCFHPSARGQQKIADEFAGTLFNSESFRGLAHRKQLRD